MPPWVAINSRAIGNLEMGERNFSLVVAEGKEEGRKRRGAGRVREPGRSEGRGGEGECRQARLQI